MRTDLSWMNFLARTRCSTKHCEVHLFERSVRLVFLSVSVYFTCQLLQLEMCQPATHTFLSAEFLFFYFKTRFRCSEEIWLYLRFFFFLLLYILIAFLYFSLLHIFCLVFLSVLVCSSRNADRPSSFKASFHDVCPSQETYCSDNRNC